MRIVFCCLFRRVGKRDSYRKIPSMMFEIWFHFIYFQIKPAEQSPTFSNFKVSVNQISCLCHFPASKISQLIAIFPPIGYSSCLSTTQHRRRRTIPTCMLITFRNSWPSKSLWPKGHFGFYHTAFL